MVNANVKIIEELKLFLASVVDDPTIKSIFITNPSDFSRVRKLPLEKIVGILINLPKRSLSIELQDFFESINDSANSCTKGAFSLQRTKLKPLFFKAWNDFLVQLFYRYYGPDVKLWEGFRLLGVDGANMSVMNVPEIVAHFGTTDNQYGGVPMARAMQIHDVLNDITIWGDIFPRCYSENFIIAHKVAHLPEDSLTLFDRGFPSYVLMYLMSNQEQPRHFVMRCKTTFNNEVKSFVESKKKNAVINIYPSEESIVTLKGHGFRVTRNTGLKIRLVKVVLPDGEVEVLLTSLLDDKKFKVKKFGKLYFMRWKIETAFSKQKNQLQMEIFSGHRVVCIEQDYAAGLFVANLQSIIEKQCEDQINEISKHRCHTYKVNKNISWALLKNRVLKIFIKLEDSYSVLIELQDLFIKNIEPERPNRSFTRPKVKRKRGKYQTFTNYRRAI